ncbi:MAG TPA: amidohydrolase [Chloroflexota bacterium]|nr:amidohydrolase [Chloroflexota bacterium]
MPIDLLIENGTIVTMNPAGEVLAGGAVAIEGARIQGVYRAGTVPRDLPVARRLDARGRVVMPGLINAHTHLFQTLIRGVYERLGFLEWLRRIYLTGRVLEPEDCFQGALVGLGEAVQSGVTTVVDHHFLNRTPELAEATIAAFQQVGVRCVLARCIMDVAGLAPPEVVETPEAGLRACEALLARHRAAIAQGRVTIWTGPNTPPLNASEALIRETHAFARAHGIGVSAHVAEAASVVEAVRAQHGAEGVVALFDRLGALGPRLLAAHSVHLSAREIALLAQAGASVAHNPVSNGFLGDGIAPVVELLAAGVNVALGTDGAASNNSQDMFEVMKVAALFQRARTQDPAALPPETVLRLATINGARSLGLEHELGSLEPGKRADLIIVDLGSALHNCAVHDVLSHLVFTARATDVRTVLVDGRILLEEGVLQTIDAEAVRAAGQARGESLVRRLAAT